MIRKSVFALIAVALKGVGVDIQAYLGLLVIVVSWLLHTQFKPYNKSLNLDWLEGKNPKLDQTLSLCNKDLSCISGGNLFHHFRGALPDQ